MSKIDSLNEMFFKFIYVFVAADGPAYPGPYFTPKHNGPSTSVSTSFLQQSSPSHSLLASRSFKFVDFFADIIQNFAPAVLNSECEWNFRWPIGQ